MKKNYLTIQPHLLNLKHLKYRNKRNSNNILPSNPTFNKSIKIRNLSRNNSCKIKVKNILKSSSSSKIYPIKSKDLADNNSSIFNSIIYPYKFKKSKIENNIQNIKSIINNNKIKQFQFNHLKKNNFIFKVNHGVNTNNSYLYPNKTNRNFRPLSNNKDILKLIKANDINEICFSVRKRIKNTKFNRTLRNYLNDKLKKDKYAYIYLSDNAESIKYSRRVNYNPLNV